MIDRHGMLANLSSRLHHSAAVPNEALQDAAEGLAWLNLADESLVNSVCGCVRKGTCSSNVS